MTLGQSAVGCRELRVAALSVRALGVEVVRATEVIFCAGAADCREIFVAVDVEFNFALAPPAVVVHTPGYVCADVVAPAFDAVEDGIDAFIRQRINATELSVKIGGVLGYVGQRVIDLVVHREVVVSQVFERDLEGFAEGHLPVAIQGAAGIDADGQGGNLGVSPPAAGEEIADGAFD